MEVLYGADDAPHELGGISLAKELLLANAVEELSAAAEVGDDVYYDFERGQRIRKLQ